MAKFVHERTLNFGIKKDEISLKYALRNRNKEMVLFLLSLEYNFTEFDFKYAIQTRSFSFMTFIKKLKCPITEDVFDFNENMKNETNNSLNGNDVYDVLNWLADSGGIFDYRSFRFAAKNGLIEMLKSLAMADYGIDSRVFTFLPIGVKAINGAKYLHENTYIILSRKDFENIEGGSLMFEMQKAIAEQFKIERTVFPIKNETKIWSFPREINFVKINKK